jgi:hypothetical protein
MSVNSPIDASLLRLVRDRTGAPETAICRAYESDSSFRAVCADVRTCSRALRRWEAADSRRAPALAAEYAELLEDLAEELRRILKPEP